jgi:alanyl-tRNA synthetase
MALFEDKYGDVVRMVTMGDSVELCAGTHVKNTKDIGKIAIISIINKGADTFRIEGATTENIDDMLHIAVKPYYDEIIKLLTKAKNILTEAKNHNINLNFDFDFSEKKLTSYKDVIFYKDSLKELKIKLKQLEKDYKQAKITKSISNLTAFTTNIEVINGIKVMAAITEDYEVDVIKQIADSLCNKYDNCFIILANIKNNNVNIIAKSNTNKVNCGSIVKELSIKCSGNGGGSPSFAQGGGRDASNLSEYLTEIKTKLADVK